MADKKLREMLKGMESKISHPEYKQTAFAKPPPLNKARVAIVTTAALLPVGDKSGWGEHNTAYHSFDSSKRDLQVAHISTNFDRSGIAADLNTAYPADRLDEMAAEGVIGSVASQHLAFHGAIIDLSTLQLDTGPAAAKQLRNDNVDVAILTPV